MSDPWPALARSLTRSATSCSQSAGWHSWPSWRAARTKLSPTSLMARVWARRGPAAAAGVTRDRHFARPATSPLTARVPASVAYQAASDRPRRACFTSPSLARLVRTSWASEETCPVGGARVLGAPSTAGGGPLIPGPRPGRPASVPQCSVSRGLARSSAEEAQRTPTGAVVTVGARAGGRPGGTPLQKGQDPPVEGLQLHETLCHRTTSRRNVDPLV